MARSIYSNLMFHISRFKIVYAGMILFDVKFRSHNTNHYLPFNVMNDHQNIETPWERLKTKRFRWQPLVPTPKSCRFGRRYFVSPLAPAVLGKYSQNESKEVERPKKPEGFWPKAQFFRIIWTNLSGFFWLPIGQQRGRKKIWRPPVAFGLGEKADTVVPSPKRLSMANLNVLNSSVKFLSRPSLASSHSWLKGLPADKRPSLLKQGHPFKTSLKNDPWGFNKLSCDAQSVFTFPSNSSNSISPEPSTSISFMISSTCSFFQFSGGKAFSPILAQTFRPTPAVSDSQKKMGWSGMFHQKPCISRFSKEIRIFY